MRNLRRTLASIVLAAPLAGCIGPGGCPQVAPTDETIAIGDMPDATLAQLVADCKSTQDCTALCDEVYSRKHNGAYPHLDLCELTTDATTGGDAVHVIASTQCIGGRRPAGYRKGRPCGHVVASYLAQQAELEAASVRAFSDLLADLVAHGAPVALRRAMVSAAADEVRHARTCTALARRHGMTPRLAPVAAATTRRTRLELAIDNAVEGCVRETYGAVVAGYQGRAASDPAIRRAMTSIARDEAKHAALSWQLHAWLWSRLDASERAAVTDAMNAARAELVATEQPELVTVAGLPDRAAATAMLAELDQTVWSAI